MEPRRPFVVANWKMFKTRAEAAAFAREFRAAGPWTGPGRIAVCPSFTALDALRAGLEGSGIALGAQNLHWEAQGAFTGEVSARMLKEAGCEFVIVGHSERRRLFGETDGTVSRKLKSALAEGLRPILCVGETLAERDAGRTEQVVWAQLTHGLDGIPDASLRSFVVAYEPVWAIGTGRNATPEQAQEVHAFIRAFLAKRGGVDREVPILYGGSVKPENLASLMRGPDVDGALVGGASLEADSFAALCRIAAGAVR